MIRKHWRLVNEAARNDPADRHDLRNHRPHLQLPASVVTPDHVHGILVTVDETGHVGAGLLPKVGKRYEGQRG